MRAASVPPQRSPAPSNAGPIADALARGVEAVVLCGGQSRRMGTDKALLGLGASTLLERAVATLSALTPRVSLACGASERYARFGLPLVVDRYSGAGPLAGLEAALASAREEWLLALACDLPRVTPALLAQLVQQARSQDLDVCMFETELGLEPLCAVYRTSCLACVRAALDGGERKVTAFLQHPTARGVLPRLGVLRADAFAGCLINVNAPADLLALGARQGSVGEQERSGEERA